LIPEWIGAVRRESPAQEKARLPASTARNTQAPAGFSPEAFPFAPDASPGRVSPPRADAKPVHIVIRLMLTDSGYLFELAGKSEYLVGRRDSQAGLTPDVDLTDWNGAASGVSRRHAILRVENGTVFIEDLGSRNETVRNNTRLLSGKRYPLSNGDVLQLGVIALSVTILEK
jgi:pSer/pThr/pTyr-binding forkhead associated (FHA) protein